MTTDPHLSKPAHALIKNRRQYLACARVSAWRVATKVRLGRLPAAADLIREFLVEDLTRECDLRILAVYPELNTVSAQACFPVPHQDPFNRMLIAQALAENVPIVSNDRALDGYGVNPAVVNRARRLSSTDSISPPSLLIPAPFCTLR